MKKHLLIYFILLISSFYVNSNEFHIKNKPEIIHQFNLSNRIDNITLLKNSNAQKLGNLFLLKFVGIPLIIIGSSNLATLIPAIAFTAVYNLDPQNENWLIGLCISWGLFGLSFLAVLSYFVVALPIIFVTKVLLSNKRARLSILNNQIGVSIKL